MWLSVKKKVNPVRLRVSSAVDSIRTVRLLKNVELPNRYTPHNDTKYIFTSLPAIRRIARQSQNATLGLFQRPNSHLLSFSIPIRSSISNSLHRLYQPSAPKATSDFNYPHSSNRFDDKQIQLLVPRPSPQSLRLITNTSQSVSQKNAPAAITFVDCPSHVRASESSREKNRLAKRPNYDNQGEFGPRRPRTILLALPTRQIYLPIIRKNQKYNKQALKNRRIKKKVGRGAEGERRGNNPSPQSLTNIVYDCNVARVLYKIKLNIKIFSCPPPEFTPSHIPRLT